ncbi:MAG TPA: DUF3501 family protein [Nitrospiraceae bacterium]|nr:DUF3501 family protein [Nitrospiraceae bacterium]
MNSLTQEDLIPQAEYEQQREAFRRRIIDLKRRRRISIGPLVTLVFENRDTLQFQIQEMVRAERILDPAKVQDELDVYNALLPQAGELSATLLIEITEAERMQHWLDAFMGLDRGQTVALRAGTEQIFAEFEGGHSHETKISAVHFVRFRPTPGMIAAINDPAVRVAFSVSHGPYQEDVDVPWAMRQEWMTDLKGSSAL